MSKCVNTKSPRLRPGPTEPDQRGPEPLVRRQRHRAAERGSAALNPDSILINQ